MQIGVHWLEPASCSCLVNTLVMCIDAHHFASVNFASVKIKMCRMTKYAKTKLTTLLTICKYSHGNVHNQNDLDTYYKQTNVLPST